MHGRLGSYRLWVWEVAAALLNSMLCALSPDLAGLRHGESHSDIGKNVELKDLARKIMTG